MQFALQMDHDGNIVPFGKYRGQPLAALQADPQYVEWLRGQAWLAGGVRRGSAGLAG